MERFAKLFESHGRQILVRKGENDDGDCALCISTMLNDSEVSFNIGFGDNETALGEAFEKFTQTQADAFGKEFEGKDNAIDVLNGLKKTCKDDD